MLHSGEFQTEANIIESATQNSTRQAPARPSEEEILQQIEQAVLDHRLPPGTKLKEVQLAEMFGVKRGTIRKVLARLANSKLVDRLPNRGATVAKPSVREGQDLFAARRAIESAILEALAARINDQQIKQLRELLDRELKAYQRGDTNQALSLSVEFHRILAKMAGNSVLDEYLNDIIRRTPLVILTHLGSDSQNGCGNQEHLAIVEALAQGKTKKAIKIMHQHLLHIENQIQHKPNKDQPELASLLFDKIMKKNGTR